MGSAGTSGRGKQVRQETTHWLEQTARSYSRLRRRKRAWGHPCKSAPGSPLPETAEATGKAAACGPAPALQGDPEGQERLLGREITQVSFHGEKGLQSKSQLKKSVSLLADFPTAGFNMPPDTGFQKKNVMLSASMLFLCGAFGRSVPWNAIRKCWSSPIFSIYRQRKMLEIYKWLEQAKKG